MNEEKDNEYSWFYVWFFAVMPIIGFIMFVLVLLEIFWF